MRKNDKGNGGGNGGRNNNGGGNNKNNHRMGLAASRVAAFNNRNLSGDTASAGNGGRANASADGGIVVIGAINSGGNKGNTVNVGNIGGGGGSDCLGGPVYIDGGTVDNSTNLNIDASGGTAIADASGGSDNLAVTSGSEDNGRRGNGGPIRSMYGLGRGNSGGRVGNMAAAGNGGQAGASADGGIVVIEEINSGGNEGNTINVGDICSGPVYVPAEPAPEKPGKPGKPGKEIVPAKTIKVSTPKGGGGRVKVNRVPSTGVGHVPASPVAPVQPTLAAVLPERRKGGEELDSIELA